MRDIGFIFVLMGVLLALAAFRPRLRLMALSLATGFYVLHALVHVYDSLRGLLPPEQWKYDLLPVYGAAALLVALTVVFARGEAVQRGGIG